MSGKNKKKRGSKDSTASVASGGSEKKTKKKAGGGGKGKSTKLGCEIFNDAAMENAYYCCHNVQDVLKSRGFAWPEAQKKKKKGKR